MSRGGHCSQGRPPIQRRWLFGSPLHRLHVLGALHGVWSIDHVCERRRDEQESRGLRDIIHRYVMRDGVY